MRKLIVALCVLSCVAILSGNQVFALNRGDSQEYVALEDDFVAKSVITGFIAVGTVVKNGVLYIDAESSGKTGTTKIIGTISVYEVKSNGKTLVTSWNPLTYGPKQFVSKECSISSGRQYLVVYQAKVYSGTIIETTSATRTVFT